MPCHHRSAVFAAAFQSPKIKEEEEARRNPAARLHGLWFGFAKSDEKCANFTFFGRFFIMDYNYEQSSELEALDSIYYGDMQGISTCQEPDPHLHFLILGKPLRRTLKIFKTTYCYPRNSPVHTSISFNILNNLRDT